jgi:hypothetical protein
MTSFPLNPKTQKNVSDAVTPAVLASPASGLVG